MLRPLIGALCSLAVHLKPADLVADGGGGLEFEVGGGALHPFFKVCSEIARALNDPRDPGVMAEVIRAGVGCLI